MKSNEKEGKRIGKNRKETWRLAALIKRTLAKLNQFESSAEDHLVVNYTELPNRMTISTCFDYLHMLTDLGTRRDRAAEQKTLFAAAGGSVHLA